MDSYLVLKLLHILSAVVVAGTGFGIAYFMFMVSRSKDAVRRLRSDGHNVVVFDNLSTGHAWSVGDTNLVVADLDDHDKLTGVFNKYNIETVLHFAASIDVNESIKDPLKYYTNNTSNTVNLLAACKQFDVERFVFSSTTGLGNPLLSGLPMGQPAEDQIPVIAA